VDQGILAFSIKRMRDRRREERVPTRPSPLRETPEEARASGLASFAPHL